MEKEWISVENLQASHNCFHHLDELNYCKVCGINVEDEYYRMKKEIKGLKNDLAYEENMKNYYFLHAHE